MPPRRTRVAPEIKAIANLLAKAEADEAESLTKDSLATDSVESTEAPKTPEAPKPPTQTVKRIAPVPKGTGLMTSERYIKVIAVVDSEGLYGHSRYAIKKGQTYSFERALALWLMETGRAK